MYSYNELNAVELSPTKKDYYQVWNELLDTASKLSERWDPATTNESDPGVVLLKVLTAVADKLSYNIDANTLEAFMPSAAQESSMRKLCEMLGYTMRFYRSATTNVRITYNGDVFPTNLNDAIKIDRFSNIKNIDNTINYITLQDVVLSPTQRSQVIECIEGTLVTCETNLGNRVTFEHLDDNYRFYFPEHQIASNKIFVSNIDSADNTFWEAVDNLNTHSLGTKIFKFGYDSARGIAFLQFPEDVSSLMGSGLCIQFIRTNGIKGNVSVNTLKTFEAPASWTALTAETSDEVTSENLIEGETSANVEWTDTTLYSVTNLSAAIDGKDPETIDEAYWNFQKTVGTFDTLVTCRDYMNKIYQLTLSEVSDVPLVSNILVSDIRDDINRAYSLSTLTKSGATTQYKVHQEPPDTNIPRIQYFDLVLYPFLFTEGYTKGDYENSFTYTDEKTLDIVADLADQKTIAHKFIKPEADDIACIKAYFQLSARLATTERVTTLEAAEIEAAAHRALYKEFNMRRMSFGEELPYDLIFKTLTHSHTKIKNVILDDPKIYLTVHTADNKEYPITGDYIFKDLASAERARNYYLDLTLKNALAGKVPLFNFDKTFESAFNLEAYPVGSSNTNATASKVLLKYEEPINLDNGTSDECTSCKIISFAEANTKTFSYTNTKIGSCFIDLQNLFAVPTKDNFEAILTAVSFIKFAVYKPGNAKAAYILTYKPECDTFTNKFSKLKAELESSIETEVPEFTSISADDILEDMDSIQLLSIPFNDASTQKCFDKVTVTLAIDEEKLDSFSTDFGCSVLEVASLHISWTDTTTEEAIGSKISYDTFLEANAESYVTIAKEADNSKGLQLKTVAEKLPAISEIESEFRVNTDLVSPEEPLVLKEKEVIQFRAPNFKTVKTYPAYVNYYFKSSNKSGGKATAAIPATMQSLTEFFNGGPEGYYEGEKWNRSISWQEKLDALLKTDPTYSESQPDVQPEGQPEGSDETTPSGAANANSKFMIKCFSTDEKINANTPAEVSAQTALGKSLKKYGSLFTNGLKVTYDLNDYEEIDGKRVIKAKISAVKGFQVFTIPKETKAPGGTPIVYEIPNSTDFYGINIDSTTFADITQWLQGTRDGGDSGESSALSSVLRADVASMSNPADLDSMKPPLLSDLPSVSAMEKPIKGLYTKGRSNLSKKPGFLVDENRCTYELINIVPTDISFDDIYVPRLWPDTTASHTKDGLGAGATFNGIPADAEYALKSGEYLLFTYSSSEGREDGTSVVKNIAYGAGTIIKANFTLLDADDQRELAPYTKTSDFGPWTVPDNKCVLSSTTAGGTIKGMFTLGATEQIEIRERIQVTLDNSVAGLYWELKSPRRDAEFEYFPSGSYTLQPGEYLYYTDSAQEAMAYYGSGTEVVTGSNTPELKRPFSQSKLSAEQINKLGLIASIPWTYVALSEPDASITINEFQYVNLIEEDQLKYIQLPEGATSHILGAEWTTVESADFISAGVEDSLPTFLIDDCKWSACGRLDLIMSPTISQTLNVHQNSYGQEVARDIIKLYGYRNGANENSERVLTQVYTPLVADLDTEDFVTETEPSDSEILSICEVPFQRIENSEYFEPVLSAGETWQEHCGSKLNIGVMYYAKCFVGKNCICETDNFSVKLHYYNDNTTAGTFHTLPHGTMLKNEQKQKLFTINLIGEFAYPRLLIGDTDSNISEITLKVYLVNTSESQPDATSSGKTVVPLTLFANTSIISNTGTVSFADLSDSTFSNVSIKACKKKTLKLSNGDIFSPVANKTSHISLGHQHLDSNKPVVELSALIPVVRFGLLTIYVEPLSGASTDKVTIKTNANLAIFNNSTSFSNESSTFYNWNWWADEKCTKATGEETEYTLKYGLNTIVIKNTGNLKLYAPANADLAVVLGELKIVHLEKLFNPQLAYGRLGAKFAIDPSAMQFTTDTEKEEEVLTAQQAFDQLLTEKMGGGTVSADAITEAFENLSTAKLKLAQRSTEIDLERFETKVIAGESYQSIFIDNALALKWLDYLDPDKNGYYTNAVNETYGIELNDLDPNDTLLLAKHWFDKQNVANKFVVSALDTIDNHLENYIVVSKTSKL